MTGAVNLFVWMVYFAAVAAVFLLFYAGLAWNFSRWAGQGKKRPMAAFSLICSGMEKDSKGGMGHKRFF